jgi:hypothetical protein
MCEQLDDWVLCRIYKKKTMTKSLETNEDYTTNQMNMTQTNNDSEQELVKFPRTCSLTNLLEMDYLGPISQILSDGSYNSTFEYQINTAHGGLMDPFVKSQMVEMPKNNSYEGDLEKYNVKQNSSLGNQVFDQRE